MGLWAGMTYPMLIPLIGTSEWQGFLWVFLAVPFFILGLTSFSEIRSIIRYKSDLKQIVNYRVKNSEYVIELDASGFQNGASIHYFPPHGDRDDRRQHERRAVFLENQMASLGILFVNLTNLGELSGMSDFIHNVVGVEYRMLTATMGVRRSLRITHDEPYERIIKAKDENGLDRTFTFRIKLK